MSLSAHHAVVPRLCHPPDGAILPDTFTLPQSTFVSWLLTTEGQCQTALQREELLNSGLTSVALSASFSLPFQALSKQPGSTAAPENPREGLSRPGDQKARVLSCTSFSRAGGSARVSLSRLP